MKFYRELAEWWPLISPVEDYAVEAEDLIGALRERLGRMPATLLELGCGGGHLAHHLAPHSQLTLVELSPEMLALAARLNPEAEAVQGDMRSVRLGRRFECVLIHDAISYMTTEADLRAALTTARVHLAPGGIAVVLPDDVTETFSAEAEVGGADEPSGRGVRCFEWSHPPRPGETQHDVDYVFTLRHADGRSEVVHDPHVNGLFSRAQWRQAFLDAGFAEPERREDAWREDTFFATLP